MNKQNKKYWCVVNKFKICSNYTFNVVEDEESLTELFNYRDTINFSQYYFRIEEGVIYLYEFPIFQAPSGYALFIPNIFNKKYTNIGYFMSYLGKILDKLENSEKGQKEKLLKEEILGLKLYQIYSDIYYDA